MSEDPRYSYLHEWRMEAQKKDPDYLRRKALRELYHTTVEWYEEKLKEQSGHCALCEEQQQSKECGKRLSVDHDHNHCPSKRACGNCNRGLLCFNCNKKLGMLEIFMRECESFDVIPKDNSWTEKALQYLDKYRKGNFEGSEVFPYPGKLSTPTVTCSVCHKGIMECTCVDGYV